MLETNRLKDVLVEYKKDFVSSWWQKEKFKWEAVKCFQDNWDVDAVDFAQMLADALAKTDILLTSYRYFPLGMIKSFANAAPEEVREMYIELFNESVDVVERILKFKNQAAILHEKYGNGENNHYQDEGTISTYLWLRYPDKYYIYKFGEAKSVADALGSDLRIKKGAYADNLKNFYTLYDEVSSELMKDNELASLLNSQITEDCYPDLELKTLTTDIGFFISRLSPEKQSSQSEGLPSESSLKATVEDCEDCLDDGLKKYTKADFLNEVYISEEQYDSFVGLLRNKNNIILQGAPGVGKTYAAKRLAYSLMGEKDESRIEFIQFHQNYSYEDFIMGYKPTNDGFVLKEGIFYKFCEKANEQPDREFFFIIDEINRGNMSKIFGELLMLIEKDYRGTEATLAYTGSPFAVPKNLFIIGMMNTADRSLAMIDYALRRRFGFITIEPGFNSRGFKQYQSSLKSSSLDTLIEKVVELNNQIANDRSLGKGFCIGHSYFCGCECGECSDDWLRAIVEYDILPMLSEYWFDDIAKLQRWETVLRGVF